MKLPIYITIKEVADVLKWSTWRTRRWLAAANCLVKRGDLLVTTPEKLRNAFPEVWDEMLDIVEDREESQD